MRTFIILLFIIPGALIFLLGRYIKRTGYVEVLKSYNEKFEYNRDGLKDYAGKLMMFTGISTVVISVVGFILALVFTNIDIRSYFLIVYVLITIRYVIKLRFSCNKFLISKEISDDRK